MKNLACKFFFLYLKCEVFIQLLIESIVATTARLVIQCYEKYVHNTTPAMWHRVKVLLPGS